MSVETAPSIPRAPAIETGGFVPTAGLSPFVAQSPTSYEIQGSVYSSSIEALQPFTLGAVEMQQETIQQQFTEYDMSFANLITVYLYLYTQPISNYSEMYDSVQTQSAPTDVADLVQENQTDTLLDPSRYSPLSMSKVPEDEHHLSNLVQENQLYTLQEASNYHDVFSTIQNAGVKSPQPILEPYSRVTDLIGSNENLFRQEMPLEYQSSSNHLEDQPNPLSDEITELVVFSNGENTLPISGLPESPGAEELQTISDAFENVYLPENQQNGILIQEVPDYAPAELPDLSIEEVPNVYRTETESITGSETRQNQVSNITEISDQKLQIQTTSGYHLASSALAQDKIISSSESIVYDSNTQCIPEEQKDRSSDGQREGFYYVVDHKTNDQRRKETLIAAKQLLENNITSITGYTLAKELPDYPQPENVKSEILNGSHRDDGSYEEYREDLAQTAELETIEVVESATEKAIIDNVAVTTSMNPRDEVSMKEVDKVFMYTELYEHDPKQRLRK